MTTTPLRPIFRKRLPDVVVGQIQDLIRSGQLRPGDQMPTERELCEMLSVGRSTVREALRDLTAIGVVQRGRNGLYINPEPPLIVESISRSTIQEVFEARRLIEVGLAHLAAQRASEEEIAAISKWLPAEGVTPSVEGFQRLDVGFHYAISSAAENQIITGYLNRVRDELFVSHKFYTALDSLDPGQAREFVERTVVDHRRIYKAIAEHRPSEAQRAMEGHFQHVEWEMLRLLDRENAEER